jgi:predicted pyridoxine 5'-phosphate oxidase superfamily flavin-nucleotide-binding protein
MPDSMMAKAGPDLLDAERARALVESYPKPGAGAVAKDIGRLDEHMRKFIEKSPFCTLATSDAEGRLDVTPSTSRRAAIRRAASRCSTTERSRSPTGPATTASTT